MIGQTIEARPKVSIALSFFLMSGLALAGWAVVATNPHPALAAVLPLSLAIALWFGRQPAVVLLVERDGLMLLGTHKKILYDNIAYITVAGRELSANSPVPEAPIQIEHQGGCLIVPTSMNVDRAEFYRYLLSQLPSPPPATPHPVLQPYVDEQVAKFGANKICLIKTRRVIVGRSRLRQKRAIFTALVFTCVLWFISGVAMSAQRMKEDEYVPWIAAGTVFGIVSALAYLAQSPGGDSQMNRLINKFSDACIVIGPAGLAMVQGDVKGAMRWDEVQKVTTKISQFFRTTRTSGLQLNIRGGQILVMDIYEWPPGEIAALIESQLRGPG